VRFAVLAVALLATPAVALLATPAVAQVPASAPDSTTRIFNDVFLGQPAPPAYVTLANGTVYRVEIEPASAQLIVRMARHTSLPPLFLVPLGDATGPAQGAAYLLVPRVSGEYRLDVTTTGDEPVRVRIELDPRENARWARMREETRDQPPAGFSLRAVYVGAFRSPGSTPTDTMAKAAGAGVEACFALLPHSAWLKEFFGGCVFSVAVIRRGAAAGSLVLFGTAPRVEVARLENGGSVSVELRLAYGTETSQSTNYLEVGAGGLLGLPVPLTHHRLFAEFELGIAAFSGSAGPHVTQVDWVPRLGAGLQLDF
jgi:hypothetical protein